MKFNLFRHIKEQQEETDLFIANCDYKKHFAKKFRKSKTKSSLDYSEPSHRKSGKLLQGRKENWPIDTANALNLALLKTKEIIFPTS